jgi:hypothetical protein
MAGILSDATGIGALGSAVEGIVNHFFPDKTQEEKDKAALELQTLMAQFNLTSAQIGVDQAEAASGDRWQHWRGALGWVCVFSFAWHYVGLPLFGYVAALGVQMHLFGGIPIPPALDISELYPLLMGMLGLGAMHTYQTVKAAN